jgi:hypothetical protein
MKIISYIRNSIWLSTLFVFVLFFLIYGSIYFFADGISAPDDHFFHFKFSYLLRTDGLDVVNNFKWLPTMLGKNRYELSLFQISLIPFTFFNDLFTGLRVSDTFGAALSLSVIYFALRRFNFKHSFLILLILLSSDYFSFRLFHGRGYVLTLGLVLLELYFMQKKKYAKFFWVSFLHILWHKSLMFFPPMIFFAVWISRYLSEKKIEWKGLFISLAAVFCGMLFYPNFPKNIFEWIRGLVNISSDVKTGLKLEGNELYAKNSLDMFVNNPIFSFLVIISIALVVYLYIDGKKEESLANDNQKEKLTEAFSFFLMLIVFNLGAIAISGRFLDYYFIFVVVLLVSVLRLLFIRKEIIVNEKISKYIIAACFIFFSYLSLNNFLDLRIKVANSDYRTIKAPAEWIRDNSEEKELVYLYNWSDFTKAFFYDDKNIYSWGIEPKVLINRDAKLYWNAYNIMAYSFYCEKQEDCEKDVEATQKIYEKMNKEDQEKFEKENSKKIINSIKNDFGSRFILSTSPSFSGLIKLNEDLIEDQFESVSEKDGNYKITAFKLK